MPIQEKLKKITKNGIRLYLKLWRFDDIEFCGGTASITELSKIWGFSSGNMPRAKKILTVTDQEENQISASKATSYGIRQLLYELEVCSIIPSEILPLVSAEGWSDFIVRFFYLYQQLGFQVSFSKKTPLADSIYNILKETVVFDEKGIQGSSYGRYMILQNGNGGTVQSFLKIYSHTMRVEELRLIVLFRAYLMELLCSHFKDALQKKGVALFEVNWNWALTHPLYPKEKITSFERQDRERYNISQIVNNEASYEDFLKDIYEEQYDLDYIREVMDIPNRLNMGIGNVAHEDKSGPHLNVFMGERKTTNTPPQFENSIYLLGGCVFFGYAVADSQTIASYLQKILNERMPERKWRVVNYGTWGGDIDWTYQRFYKIPFRPGDLVLVSYAGFMPLGKDWEKRDISIFLKNVDTKKEFYFNGIVHCNRRGYQAVAEGVFKQFQEFFSRNIPAENTFYLKPASCSKQAANYEQQIKEYKNRVKNDLPELFGKQVGAIVMNCNPFTLGHQYLIDYAANQVEILIIFVVEEDKSYFRFEDRIRLVKQGTAHLDNVYVIPSGKMIISTITFPGYFLKDTPEAVTLDASCDVSVFGEYIAKSFHITTRFVGEEPFDPVTANYNETMRRILPSYGIELVIIPRKESHHTAISASRVRKLLAEKKFDEIETLVPKTTFSYLCDRYRK